MRIKSLILAALCMVTVGVYAQSNYPFNGLDMNMGNLSRLSDAKTRSISPENFTGEKGKGGMADPVRDKDQRNVANAHHAAKDLGKGWKVNPFIIVKPGETITIAEIEGPGAIQQIWMTPTGNWRFSILRMYWDDEKEPSVECPVGDFFCSAYNEYAQLSSLAVCVNPGSAFNCYWKMPFRKKARITLENINTAEEMRLYYLVDHFNPQRPVYACGKDGGLLLCTWPKGGMLSLPFVYSNEVWTGIEYQVASHLMMKGEVEKGLDIVRECRERYDGRVRNPFNEIECGHWYARAMASYGMLQGLTGVRYDAVDKTMYINSKIGDFKSFISTDTGFGTIEWKAGKPVLNVVYGNIDVKRYNVSGKIVD